MQSEVLDKLNCFLVYVLKAKGRTPSHFLSQDSNITLT